MSGPKKYDTEPTLVMPREALAPASSPSIVDDDMVTMEQCPACAACRTCGGRHLIECPTCSTRYRACDGACASCVHCLGEHLMSPVQAAEVRRAIGIVRGEA